MTCEKNDLVEPCTKPYKTEYRRNKCIIRWQDGSYKCLECPSKTIGVFKVFIYIFLNVQRKQGWKRSNFDRHFESFHKEKLEPVNHIINYSKKPKFDSAKPRLDSYLKLIVISGRPFEIVNDEGLVELAQTENIRLNLTVTTENLKLHMNERYSDLVYKIKEIIDKKYITLKFDCASRHNRQFMCISAQFIQNDCIKNICLDFVELYDSHTAQNLSKIIFNTLKRYQISKKYVIAATTDTASNMIATVRKLNLNFELEFESGNSDDSSENILSHELYNSCPDIFHVKCCSHVYNLIVNDFLSYEPALMGKARTAVKFLRRPNIINILQRMNLNIPPIENITRYVLIYINPALLFSRWSSTYIMLNYLNQNVENLKDMLSEILCEEYWPELKLICSVLSIPYNFTIESQKLQNTPGDIFINWLDSKRKLLKLSNRYSGCLIACIEKREKAILANPGFLAGCYFDPRTKNLLSTAEIEIAKEFIRNFYNK